MQRWGLRLTLRILEARLRGGPMVGTDEHPSIPAPTADEQPFKIGEILTLYEAAMVYAGRYPYPRFFALKNGSVKDHIDYLKLGIAQPPRKRARAKRKIGRAHV